MLLRFFASTCLVASLASCAAPVPRLPAVAAQADSLGEQGTIVAMHAVPTRDPRPVRQLLRGLGGGHPPAGTMEFIVRRDDGDLIAVVQPGRPTLQPGRPVRILRGTQTRLTPMPAVMATR